MDMFVLRQKHQRTVIFEAFGYVFHDLKGYVVVEITQESRKLQRMANTKDPEVGSEILPFSSTASSRLSDIDLINEMKLNDVVDEQ